MLNCTLPRWIKPLWGEPAQPGHGDDRHDGADHLVTRIEPVDIQGARMMANNPAVTFDLLPEAGTQCRGL